MKGATIEAIHEYQMLDRDLDCAVWLSRHLLLGFEGFDAVIACDRRTITLNAELCLVLADRVSTLAHEGIVLDLHIKRFIKSRSGRDGTVERIGPAARDLVMSGYRRRLTSQDEIDRLIVLLERVSNDGMTGRVMVKGTSTALKPVKISANLAAVMVGGLRAIASDPLVTILTVAPNERLTWRAARYLLLQHFKRPPEELTDPLRHHLSLGRFSYGHVCRLLEAAGVPFNRHPAVHGNPAASS